MRNLLTLKQRKLNKKNMFLNRVQIIGNLTREIELRTTPNGKSVTSFSLATNEKYRDNTGKMVETVDYHNCVAWGKIAELLNQYTVKGQKLFIEGKLKTSSYEKDGKKVYKTDVVVSNMQFGQKPAGSTQATPNVAPQATQPTTPPAEEQINVDEIPF